MEVTNEVYSSTLSQHTSRSLERSFKNTTCCHSRCPNVEHKSKPVKARRELALLSIVRLTFRLKIFVRANDIDRSSRYCIFEMFN